MHILFIAERFPPEIGGVAASAGRIVRSLAELGHTVHIITLTREVQAGSVERKPFARGAELHRLGQSKNLDFSLQQAEVFLAWLLGQHPFSLIWGHFVQTAGFLATWTGRLHGMPVVLSLRGNDFDRQLFPPGDLARLEWCLRQADHLTTVSVDLARKVHVLVGRDSVVLPNSADTDLFCPGPRELDLLLHLGLSPDQPILGFSGELRAKKGLNFLLQAFAEVRQVRPVQLLVIGEVRGGDQGEFERARLQFGLDAGLYVTGHLEDPALVVRHLRLCDLFLLPSLWEGMPNGLLEAMACGVPVIASDAGGIPEIVQDGHNGLLVPRTHLHTLGRCVLGWLALPEEQKQQMAQAGRQTVAERHSLAAERTALAGLLGRIASSSS